MPYRTIWEPKGVVWKFYGAVTAQEISDANEEFFESENSDKATFQIIDALEVTSVAWSERHIKEMAAMDIGADVVIKNLKVAYVSQDQEVIGKLEKYIEISKQLSTSWKFKGFYTLQEARAWIQY